MKHNLKFICPLFESEMLQHGLIFRCTNPGCRAKGSDYPVTAVVHARYWASGPEDFIKSAQEAINIAEVTPCTGTVEKK
jgi:hypothetical protein